MPKSVTQIPGSLCTLILGVCALFAQPSAAQMVPDSIQMELHLYTYAYVDFPYANCGAGIYATWPDLAGKALGRPTNYRDYSLVALEGMYVPRGAGELANGEFTERIGISVPDDHFGHWPSLGTGTQGGAGNGYSESCADYEQIYAESMAGVHSGLNGAPFWIPLAPEGGHGWYAIYNVGAGTPIADFKWRQQQGNNVFFDARFPISREVEEDGRKPVVKWEWTFHDGSTGAGSTLTKEYSEPGTYAVTLKVTDDDDQTDEITRTIKVRGVVLEYETLAPANANVFEDVGITGIIRNVGTVKAENVAVSRSIWRKTTFPEAEAGTRKVESTNIRPASDTTYASIEAGGTVFVYQTYRIDKSAEEFKDGKWVPTPAVWESRIINVRGTDENGFPAVVRNACDERACTNKTRIFVQPLAVDLESSTVNGITASVNSGLKRFSDSSINFWYFHRVPPGNNEKCYTGCVELEIEVKTPDGLPVEGAEVELTRLLTDTRVTPPSIVTPDQGGGVFCHDGQCGSTLTVKPTPADGKLHVQFWVPGVMWPVDAHITAKATKDGFAEAEYEHDLSIQPTPIDFGRNSTVASPADMTALTISSGLVTMSEWVDPQVWCSWAMGKLRDGAAKLFDKSSGSLLKKGASKGIGLLCGEMFEKHVYDDEFKRESLIERRTKAKDFVSALGLVSGTLSAWWFESQFQMTTTGTGAFHLKSSKPFWEYQSEFIPFIHEINRSLVYQWSTTGIPPTLEMDLYEVSHKKESGDEVHAFYVDFRSVNSGGTKVEKTKLITAGYTPVTFLSKNDEMAVSASAVSMSDQSITITTPPGKTAADDSTFALGHVVAIDPGLPNQEFVQIVSISGSTLGLSVPLAFDHPAGAQIAYSDSLAVGPPDAPINVTGVSGIPGTSTTPTLEWFSFAPATSFVVEVATDTLFTDIVQTHDDLPEPVVTLDELSDRTRYYWRAAAKNLLGQSDWSHRYSFYTGRPWGDDLVEARELTSDIDMSQFAWHFAATSETGEVDASCGAGGNSTWYAYTPTVSGPVAIETFDSGFNTVLSVWTGSSHPLTEVACNDDYENGEHDAVPQSYLELNAVAGTTYYVRVSGRDNDEGALFLSTRVPTQVGVEETETPIVADFDIEVFPNPANEATTVVVHNPERGPLTLELYDILGRRRSTVATGVREPGVHEFAVDLSGLAAGVYFVRARYDGRHHSQMFSVGH